jgi:predicted  nucleic acid-binding Zn-ribbon protein
MSNLAALAVVQEHDTAIDQLQRSLSSLPERAAAQALNERRHAADVQLAALASKLEALAEAEEAVEKELAVVEQRADSLDATLRSPGSATRDAQAIIHEIDQLREQAGALEERGLALLDERDTLLNEQSAAQAELDAVAADAPGVLAALKQAEGDAGESLAKLQAERAEAAAALDDALLATYDKLRARMDGVAVARVVSGTCTGCHLGLSAVDLEHMAKLGPGQYATCEQCGRILIPS